MIGKAIVALIKADSTLNTLIGGRAGPWPLPQGQAFPSISFIVEDKPATGCDSGSSIIKAEVNIAIFGDTLLQVETIGTEVKRVLHLYSGTAGGIQVQGIHYRGGTDDFDKELRRPYIEQMYSAIHIT